MRRISIHALREEGDEEIPYSKFTVKISIHALREEGDQQVKQRTPGRDGFLSTPSARRATCAQLLLVSAIGISIHALREEGDVVLNTLEHRLF